MEEKINSSKQSTLSESKQHSSAKRQVRNQKRSVYQATMLKNKFKIEEKWTVLEKTRLLKALKNYDCHNISSIAMVVGTKSEEQVEEKIRSYRASESASGTSIRVEGPGSEKSPIEDWIDLFQEMTTYEPTDHSLFISKVLGLIARNEKFADSGFPQLKWRNIYQFLADITDDRVEVQKLSDMESLVVLDMMHSIGDTLLQSDTSEQKRILDFKYNLLSFSSNNPKKNEREINVNRVAQALSNDIWNIEDVQLTSLDTPSLSLLMNDALSSHESLDSADQDMTEINNQPVTSASDMSSHHKVPGTSDSASDTVSKREQTDKQHTRENSAEVNNSGVPLFQSHQFGNKFVRPKYFTLNPFCMPTQLLAFKSKTNT